MIELLSKPRFMAKSLAKFIPQLLTKKVVPHSIFSGSAEVPIDKFIRVLVDEMDQLDVSPLVVLVGVLYARRLTQCTHFLVSTSNVFRLLLVSTLVAQKFLCDRWLSNRAFAEIVQLPVQDINKLELEFLALIQFRLDVTEDEFTRLCLEVIACI